MTKKTYKVAGMDCDACAKLIELDLEDLGVTAKCNYSKELLEVEFDEKKAQEEKIKQVVKAAGYELTKN